MKSFKKLLILHVCVIVLFSCQPPLQQVPIQQQQPSVAYNNPYQQQPLQYSYQQQQQQQVIAQPSVAPVPPVSASQDEDEEEIEEERRSSSRRSSSYVSPFRKSSNSRSISRSYRRSSSSSRRGDICKTGYGNDICYEDQECIDVCYDTFSSRSVRDECFDQPRDLVFYYGDLIGDLEDGNVNIDSDTLSCLLDLSDKEFLKEVGDLKSSATKDFLEEISSDYGLAAVILKDDDDFRIMNRIRDNLGNEGIEDFLKETLSGSEKLMENFLEEETEDAWEWLDSYVKSEVRDDREALKVYCAVYTTESRVGNAMETSDLFEEYHDNLLTDYCNLLVAGSHATADKCEKYKSSSSTDGRLKTVCNNPTRW